MLSSLALRGCVATSQTSLFHLKISATSENAVRSSYHSQSAKRDLPAVSGLRAAEARRCRFLHSTSETPETSSPNMAAGCRPHLWISWAAGPARLVSACSLVFLLRAFCIFFLLLWSQFGLYQRSHQLPARPFVFRLTPPAIPTDELRSAPISEGTRRSPSFYLQIEHAGVSFHSHDEFPGLRWCNLG